MLDRPSIYAIIRVAELWRYDGKKLVIEQLQEDGTYAPSDTSQFLSISARDAERWLIDEDSSDRSAWEERLAEWARGLVKE